MTNRAALWAFGLVSPVWTGLSAVLLRTRRPALAVAECRNKCRIMQLFVRRSGHLPRSGPVPPLGAVLRECCRLDADTAIWALERLGKELAERHLGPARPPAGVLRSIDHTWDRAQLMLHAGLGLGFAKSVLGRLPGVWSEAQLRDAVARTVDLCRRNARVGYCGAALESLGLVARFLKGPAFCRRVHGVLAEHEPHVAPYFWRGVGRCLYFTPANFVPPVGPTCRAIRLAASEAPSVGWQDTLLAGVAWAIVLVNMRTPDVLEYVLETTAGDLVASPAFVNGIMCAVVMRHDTNPDDPVVRQLRGHRPGRRVRSAWERLIEPALDFSVGVAHPVLKRHQRLDEIFCTPSLRQLVATLEGS